MAHKKFPSSLCAPNSLATEFLHLSFTVYNAIYKALKVVLDFKILVGISNISTAGPSLARSNSGKSRPGPPRRLSEIIVSKKKKKKKFNLVRWKITHKESSVMEIFLAKEIARKSRSKTNIERARQSPYLSIASP
jgi:hypothetical protein